MTMQAQNPHLQAMAAAALQLVTAALTPCPAQVPYQNSLWLFATLLSAHLDVASSCAAVPPLPVTITCFLWLLLIIKLSLQDMHAKGHT